MTIQNALCAFFNTSGEFAAGVLNNSGISGMSLANALKQLPNATSQKACTLLHNCSNLLSLTCGNGQIGCSGLTSDQTNRLENTLCQTSGFSPGTIAAISTVFIIGVLITASIMAYPTFKNIDTSSNRSGYKQLP